MIPDSALARAVYIKNALSTDPSGHLDGPTAIYLCEQVIAHDEALRHALDLVRRFPCDHTMNVGGKLQCARCLTLEAVAGALSPRGNGKKEYLPRVEKAF